jgi:uncharacterized coiled-coil protein SlyX
MTEARLNGLESRMNRVEEVLSSAGDLLLQASNVAQQNAVRMDRLEGLLVETFEVTQRNSQAIDRLGEKIDRLTDRVDSLAASGERHDRILDYLIRRDANGSAGSN